MVVISVIFTACQNLQETADTTGYEVNTILLCHCEFVTSDEILCFCDIRERGKPTCKLFFCCEYKVNNKYEKTSHKNSVCIVL
jgi:hypothetical protein